jgi:SsrA-binding protein
MGKAKKKDKDTERYRDVAQNRRALHEFEIEDKFEAGLVLTGSEVKSLRESGATIRDAYAEVRDGELWLVNAHIPEYHNSSMLGHEPLRTRKLLMHRREIHRLRGRLVEKGLTLIPLRLYFTEGGLAKLQLGIGRGRRQYDKRRAIAEREINRDLARTIRAAKTR